VSSATSTRPEATASAPPRDTVALAADEETPPVAPPQPDPAFERFARLVHAHLGVPVALVAFPQGDQEAYLGAAGLVEPWASSRSTPLSWTFCQYVLADAAPLVVTDARAVDGLRDVPAIRELDAIAYAGFPIFDVDGQVVASLCAVDHVPRAWTEDELLYLQDTALAASTEVQLRQHAERAVELRARALRAQQHGQVLLELAESFAQVSTVPDTVATIRRFATGALGAASTGVSLAYDGRTPLVPWPDDVPAAGAVGDAVERATREAAATRVTGFHATGEDLMARHGSGSGAVPPRGATACVPMLGDGRVLGVLVLTWDEPRELDDELRDTLRALGGSAALALSRSTALEDRREAAHVLQRSMLPELPAVIDVDLDAEYATATETDEVGGDWYDAIRLRDGSLALTIGDVTGHDIFAAARMGQLRSMLRGLAWAQDETPAGVLTMLDRAIEGIGLSATATAVLARLDVEPRARDGARRLRWSSAGHPPPVVVRADGTVELLPVVSDLLLGVIPGAHRTDRELWLAPGDAVVLYTDGLVERRGERLDVGLARLVRGLSTLSAQRGVSAAAVAGLGQRARTDDVAVLVARLKG